jgi:hypothetical protein
MGIHLCPGEIFSFRGGEETEYSETVTHFIDFGFPKAIITSTGSVVHLLNFLNKFGSQGTNRGLLFEIRKGHCTLYL